MTKAILKKKIIKKSPITIFQERVLLSIKEIKNFLTRKCKNAIYPSESKRKVNI